MILNLVPNTNIITDVDGNEIDLVTAEWLWCNGVVEDSNLAFQRLALKFNCEEVVCAGQR